MHDKLAQAFPVLLSLTENAAMKTKKTAHPRLLARLAKLFASINAASPDSSIARLSANGLGFSHHRDPFADDSPARSGPR